ncbi:Ni/Fe hydrogenase subunit alpha [Aquicella lusitana]|uniref:Coenzyme F420-reducing hydrogenase alpha subunit n=1 Tax=Aquicella lusitana TaxID=254246 RepID=A0A370GJ69_9COXI|nr:Ni/Fe hydrogenase subunit alpha [Aquicella lusitana]RDI43410.1 coenzyme F420-reducing hydrogenase alpha subunit [Aquicella lusitana]VVC73560.1 NAD-reducing hydrogenase HoxS subunit beta [Aquicella lusitana]
MNKITTVNIPVLTRIEGETALHVQISDGKIQSLELRIYEPPRFFEKLLVGRGVQELLDIVARICGLCPVAYQMSAVQAIENIVGIKPSAWVRNMRRLFYCGEWLQNHSLHIHMLALPDFLGYASAIDMAKDYGDEVRRGLRLQKLGNDLIKILGARSVHPVGTLVGGFSHAPPKREVKDLLAHLYQGLDDAEQLLRWLTKLELPEQSQKFVCVSLSHSSEYPMNEGKIVSDEGLDIEIDQFDAHFAEHQVSYSNALKCLLHGKSYLLGPLARVNCNFSLLPSNVKQLVKELGFQFPIKNMFYSIIARAIESMLCFSEAIRILECYDYPESAFSLYETQAGIGYGCTEAPRGLLWHRFELDKNGLIQSARIVPPTSQNQARIEEDLHDSLTQLGLDKPENELRKYSEVLIRNYDPCISCSTHFLDMRVSRK